MPGRPTYYGDEMDSRWHEPPALCEEATMSVTDKAHEIPGGGAELDRVARELHGKPYIRLDDTEAAGVWDRIEQDETGTA